MKTKIQSSQSILLIAVTIIFFLMPEIAEAQAGHMHRATRRRTAVVVSSATHANDAAQSNAAAQQTATAQANADAEASKAATAQANADAEASKAAAAQATVNTNAAVAAQPVSKLPIGSVVTALPAGSTSFTFNNMQYYQVGPNYYRTAYQGNNLVYVTIEVPK